MRARPRSGWIAPVLRAGALAQSPRPKSPRPKSLGSTSSSADISPIAFRAWPISARQMMSHALTRTTEQVGQVGPHGGAARAAVRSLFGRYLSEYVPRGRLLDCRILAPAPVYRRERPIWLEVEAPDVGVATVRGAVAGVLQRSKVRRIERLTEGNWIRAGCPLDPRKCRGSLTPYLFNSRAPRIHKC